MSKRLVYPARRRRRAGARRPGCPLPPARCRRPCPPTSAAAASAASKPSESVVARRLVGQQDLMAIALRRGWRASSRRRSREHVDEVADGILFQLERGLVHHQPALMSMIRSTSTRLLAFSAAARGHQVHDGVGQARQGGQLHGAIELDQVDVHPWRRRTRARCSRTWGNLQAGAPVAPHGRNRSPSAPPRWGCTWRSAGPAAGTAPCPRARSGCPCRSPQVRAAVLHVGRHVGRATSTTCRSGLVVGMISLRDFSGSSTSIPAAGGQRQGLVEDAALGQGEGDEGLGRRYS